MISKLVIIFNFKSKVDTLNNQTNKDDNKNSENLSYVPDEETAKKVAEARNQYQYSAGGQKLRVTQKWNPNYSTAPVIGSSVNTSALTLTQTTDYVGNKVYQNGTLKRIHIPGGYIEKNAYYYYQSDHLGTNRVTASSDGYAEQKVHYYPFGSQQGGAYLGEMQPYKYNGKELDKMHGLNLYDYSARYYDATIGRFTTVDPLAEKYYSWSPYVYVMNNPMKYIDPDGCSTWVMQNSDGTYRVVGGDLEDKDYNIYVYTLDKDKGLVRGNSIGVTTSITSFYDDTFNSDTGKDWGWIGNINPNDKSGENFFGNIVGNTPSLDEYMPNATRGGKYDFKRTNGADANYDSEPEFYRGMPIGSKDGKTVYTSARDIGNMAAGYVAGASGMPWGASRAAFDALQTKEAERPMIEGMSTQNAEYFGWKLGNRNVPAPNKLENLKRAINSFFGF